MISEYWAMMAFLHNNHKTQWIKFTWSICVYKFWKIGEIKKVSPPHFFQIACESILFLLNGFSLNCLIHYAKTMKQFPVQSPAHRLSVVKYLNFRLEMCSFGKLERKALLSAWLYVLPEAKSLLFGSPQLHIRPKLWTQCLETNTHTSGLCGRSNG